MSDMVKVKIDEDLPRAAKFIVDRYGYACKNVWDQNLTGTSDQKLWTIVQSEGRMLLTADKGFGDIRKYPPECHFGVVLLRPDDDGIGPLVELLEHLLETYDLDDLSGALTVVNLRGVRVRRGVSDA